MSTAVCFLLVSACNGAQRGVIHAAAIYASFIRLLFGCYSAAIRLLFSCCSPAVPLLFWLYSGFIHAAAFYAPPPQQKRRSSSLATRWKLVEELWWEAAVRKNGRGRGRRSARRRQLARTLRHLAKRRPHAGAPPRCVRRHRHRYRVPRTKESFLLELRLPRILTAGSHW